MKAKDAGAFKLFYPDGVTFIFSAIVDIMYILFLFSMQTMYTNNNYLVILIFILLIQYKEKYREGHGSKQRAN